MMGAIRRLIAAVAALVVAAVGPAWGQKRDRVRFGTNWVAEAEHGGFYQSAADGTYARHGLDVTIVQGGPQVNQRMLLAVSKLDFCITGNSLQVFDAVQQGVATVAVAAMFQKDPQVLIAHPGQGIDRFEDLRKLTLFISQAGVISYFQWMKAKYGFKDSQVKPYTFNPQPFLLADHGFTSYSTLIETRRDLVDKRPNLVQRFVDASIIGWYRYLYGDSRAANALIRKHNPEATDELNAYSTAKMKEFGIVDSGDAVTLGIGAMTDARMREFFDAMVKAGVTKPTVDIRKSYTTQFVNKKVGLELRPRP